MCDYKQIILQLNCNLDRYKLTLYNNNNCITYIVKNRCEYIGILLKSNYINIIISPLDEDYNTKLFFKLTPISNCLYPIHFKFSKNSSPTYVYNFYLTDINYGLKLNGNLKFISI